MTLRDMTQDTDEAAAKLRGGLLTAFTNAGVNYRDEDIAGNKSGFIAHISTPAGNRSASFMVGVGNRNILAGLVFDGVKVFVAAANGSTRKFNFGTVFDEGMDLCMVTRTELGSERIARYMEAKL